jgi:protein gp37
MADTTRQTITISWVHIDNVKTDPVLADIWPVHALTVDAIAEAMREHGYDRAEPIVLWHGRDVVVDGHTRLAAAKAAGLDQVYVAKTEFADEDDAVLYAIQRQKNRRNIDPARLVTLVPDIYARMKRQRGGDRKSQESKTSMEVFDRKNTAQEVAEVVGVSKAQIERIVAIADEPELVELVARGETSIRAAYDQVRENKRIAVEAATTFEPPVKPTPQQALPETKRYTIDEVGGAAVRGAYTIAEWTALDDRQRHQLLTAAPAEAAAQFNRTNDNVEWALWTWNPVTGCLHNCPYCYARDIAARFYPQGFVPAIVPGRLHAARHMKVPAAAATNLGEKNVFVCSMADLFGKWVPQEWIDAVLAEVRGNPQWNFLFLTKFPRRLSQQEWPDNAWVGTTVDKQFRVEIAEKSFRDVRAGVKWLSCEPMLERLTFSSLEMFDWVVVGGSSKSTQTPEFNPPIEWFEHLLRQARDAGCKVYLKPNFVNRWREYPGFDEVTTEHGIDTGWVDGEPEVER